MTSRTEYPAGYPSATPDPEPDGGLEDGGEARRAEGAEPLLGNLAESFGNRTAEVGSEGPEDLSVEGHGEALDPSSLTNLDRRGVLCGNSVLTDDDGVPLRPTASALSAAGWRALRDEARDRAEQSRGLRYALLNGLAKITETEAVKVCKTRGRMPGGVVALKWAARETDHGVETKGGFGGLASCSKVHLCPVCNGRILGGRAMEIAYAVEEAVSRGWSMVFSTWTLQHTSADSLAMLIAALSYMYARVGWDKKVRSLREQMGHSGNIRTFEVTWSWANGWHPHFHILMVFQREVSEEEVAELHAAEFQAYLAAASSPKMQELGFVGTPSIKAQRSDLVTDPGRDVARYLAKSIGLEMTYTASKKRTGSMNQWQILGKAIDPEYRRRGRMAELWLEYEKATYRLHLISWTNGLKGRLGVEERKDKEINEDDSLLGETLLSFLNWYQAIGFGRRFHLPPKLLRAAEVGETFEEAQLSAAGAALAAGLHFIPGDVEVSFKPGEQGMPSYNGISAVDAVRSRMVLMPDVDRRGHDPSEWTIDGRIRLDDLDDDDP